VTRPSIYAPLEKTYEKWAEFQEAGYDIKEFGYSSKLAKMLGKKNLLEDDSDQEEDTDEDEGEEQDEEQEDDQDEEEDAE
jgi:cobalamin biosynthesis protein CobT